MPGCSVRKCPNCGETKEYGDEFTQCDACDPVGATGATEDEIARLRAECVRLREERDAARFDHRWEMAARAECLKEIDTLNATIRRVRAALEGTPDEAVEAIACELFRQRYRRRPTTRDVDQVAVAALREDAHRILTALRERCFGDGREVERG